MSTTTELPVFSWDHARLSRPDKWFAESRAAVDSAELLFAAMANQDFSPTWHRAKSAAFLFGHGVELFLKGAIAHAGKPVEPTHSLKKLYVTYRNLYAAKRFAFPTEMEEFVAQDAAKPYYAFLKYPEDDRGNEWGGSSHITIGVWLAEVRKFAATAASIEQAIKAK